MDAKLEKECSALGGLFQSIVGELRAAFPVWEDFALKAGKLSNQLKSTIAALNAFLDALQRVADVAAGARGATRDLGTGMTRVCLRHRSIENRLKTLNAALADILVPKLLSKLEEWRRATGQLDKDHAKEYKRQRLEVKKRATEVRRLEKKHRKNGANAVAGAGGGSAAAAGTSAKRASLAASADFNERCRNMVAGEQIAVQSALREQRAQFCHFLSWLRPTMDGELALLDEVETLREVLVKLDRDSADPYSLPAASQDVIANLKGGLEAGGGVLPRYNTPPSSPGSSLGSRKSSFCSLSSGESEPQHSLIASLTAAAASGNGSGSTTLVANNSPAANSSSSLIADISHSGDRLTAAILPPPPLSPKFSSQSSGDSGFTSHGTASGYGSLQPIARAGASSVSATTVPGLVTHGMDFGDNRSGPQVPLELGGVGSSPGVPDLDLDGGGGSEQSTPSPSPSSATWPEAPLHDCSATVKLRSYTATESGPLASSSLPSSGLSQGVQRPSTISGTGGAAYESRTIKRTPLGKITFVPPSSTSTHAAGNGDLHSTKGGGVILARPKTLSCNQAKRLSAHSTMTGNTGSHRYATKAGGPPTPPPKPLSRPSSAQPPPSSSSTVEQSYHLLGVRASQHGLTPPAIPDFNQPQPDQILPQPLYKMATPSAGFGDYPDSLVHRGDAVCSSASSSISGVFSSRPGTARRPSSFVADETTAACLAGQISAIYAIGNGSLPRSCSDEDLPPPPPPLESATKKGVPVAPLPVVSTLDACMEQITRMSTKASRISPRVSTTVPSVSSDMAASTASWFAQSHHHYEGNEQQQQESYYASVRSLTSGKKNVRQNPGGRSGVGIGSSSVSSVPASPIFHAGPVDYADIEVLMRQSSTPSADGVSSASYQCPGSILPDMRRYSLVSNASSTTSTLKPGPPPPVRRNSSITAATPQAPSVESLGCSGRPYNSSRATTPIAEIVAGRGDGSQLDYSSSSSDYDTPTAARTGPDHATTSSVVRSSIHSQLRAAVGGGPVPDAYDNPNAARFSALGASPTPAPPSNASTLVAASGGSRSLPPAANRSRDSSLPSRPQDLASSGSQRLSRDDILAQIRSGVAFRRSKKK